MIEIVFEKWGWFNYLLTYNSLHRNFKLNDKNDAYMWFNSHAKKYEKEVRQCSQFGPASYLLDWREQILVSKFRLPPLSTASKWSKSACNLLERCYITFCILLGGWYFRLTYVYIPNSWPISTKYTA